MRRAFTAISLIGLFATVLGCGAENEPGEPGLDIPGGIAGAPIGGAAGAPIGAVGGAAGSSAGPPPRTTLCPMLNITRSCSCELEGGVVVPGRQICETGGWSGCECITDTGKVVKTGPGGPLSQTDPVENHIMEQFNWYESMGEIGSCEAGHYEGAFMGNYNPAITAMWTGWMGGMAVSGNVVHDIMQDETGEYFVVKDGVFEGLAMAMYPFVGEFYGTLDCTFAYFDGGLRNCYYLVYGMQYFFEGLARSRYDKISHSFIHGVWSVTEPDATGVHPPPPDANPGQPVPLAPVLGGTGTWQTTLIP